MKITNFRMSMGIPLTWTHVPREFFASFVQMERPDFTLIIKSNGPLDALRNEIVKTAQEECCTHLLMMDTDQIYPPNLVPILLSHKKDVVGALVHRRYPPFDPLMYKGKLNEYRTATDWKYGDLVEVDATGTGCLLINMDVFRKLTPPWFKFEDNPVGGIIGEDIGFCIRLKEAGYKIFVDTSIPCGHLSTLAVTRKTYELYKWCKLIDTNVASEEKEEEEKLWVEK